MRRNSQNFLVSEGFEMGKAKMVGQFNPYLPNCRADMRRMKQYKRSREYTTRHEGVISEKREERQIREMEEMKRGC